MAKEKTNDIQGLIELGKERGYLTYEDINGALPDDVTSADQIDDVLSVFDELDIDLPDSWFIGDKKSDVETGFNAGIATALVLTGYGESELKKLDRLPDHVADDLLSAAREIVSRTDHR